MLLTYHSALPILRQLGTQGGASIIKGGDFSMIKVWAGLEARNWLQASADDVSHQDSLEKSDRTADMSRLNDVLSTICFLRTYRLSEHVFERRIVRRTT